MVYILFGKDDYSRDQFLDGLRRGLATDDSGLLPANISVLNGSQLAFPDLAQVCDAYPFLAEKRLVIVEGLLSRFERRPQEEPADRGQRRATEADKWRRSLVEYLPRMPPTTVLALVEGPLLRSNPLFEALAPLAEAREFAELRGPALRGWITQRVAQAGGTIAPPAVQLMVDAVGPNLWALVSEVDKLLTYCQARPIGVEDVRALVAQSREPTVFAFVDALLDGPRSRAMLLLHQLFLEGEVSPRLTAMVSRQLRLLLEAKEMLGQGLSEQDMGQRLGLAGFPRRKTWEQAHRLSRDRLLQLYDHLLDLDVAIKTGRIADEMAWELLVAEASPA